MKREKAEVLYERMALDTYNAALPLLTSLRLSGDLTVTIGGAVVNHAIIGLFIEGMIAVEFAAMTSRFPTVEDSNKLREKAKQLLAIVERHHQ